MFSFFQRKKQPSKHTIPPASADDKQIDASLAANISELNQKTGNSPDVIVRLLTIGKRAEMKAAVIFIDGLVDGQTVHEFVIEPLIQQNGLDESFLRKDAIDYLVKEFVFLGSVKSTSKWNDIFKSLMTGDTVILVDGSPKAIIADTKGGEKRSIFEPATQVSVRGSREGFTETISTNTAMVRRIINSPDLWIETMKIGTVTHTDIAIMYLNGVASPDIIKEVKERLQRIDIDSILESGYIEQLIEDQPSTPFPTIHYTERPDAVAGNLLEGRVAIFVSGTPFVLIVPAIFIQFFQSSEDYNTRTYIASFIRMLRILVFFISLVGPASYIAATTFHQEIIPTNLLIIVAAQRDSVPFPALIEALIMEITFEILREAGIRMPKAIGSTVSIVGALVIGQAAVQAGIVSPAMVIIVSITAIASFATPSYSLAISARLLRFLFMAGAATFGFYGVILILFMMTVHLCSLRSFGVPYMSPLAPLTLSGLKDTIVRLPLYIISKGSRLFNADHSKRTSKYKKPHPPASSEMMKKGD